MSLTIRNALGLLVSGLPALIAGCVNGPMAPADDSMGASVRAARQAQTLNPGAPDQAHATTALDGKAAVSVVDRYQESFKAPSATFDIGTSGK